MKDKIVVGVIGHRNSGKSSTWNELFGETVRTGKYVRRLYLTEKEFIEVFVVSGSAEEREMYVGDIIGEQEPEIVLCSMQYVSDVEETLDYFSSNGYFLFLQWLNPGYHDGNNIPYFDYLGIGNKILGMDSILSIRDGKGSLIDRVQEIKAFLLGWAHFRGLLQED